jgi:hypothetical protein
MALILIQVWDTTIATPITIEIVLWKSAISKPLQIGVHQQKQRSRKQYDHPPFPFIRLEYDNLNPLKM